MKISIIIPTLNEEQYIPKLLESIKNQTFRDYEIIVSDAGSKDETIEIAKKYKAKIVKGGLPSRGRNNGAKAAKGEFLFFFDADVKLPKDFLEKAYNEMQNNYTDLATCEFRPLSNLYIDKLMHDFANTVVKLYQSSKEPRAPGFCILVTKRLFDRIKGFDESVKLAEDHDFVKRAIKFKPLRFLKSTYIYVSVRRMRKEGRFSLIWKYLQVELHQRFKGNIKNNIIKYEFGDFKKKNKKDFENKLIKLERELRKINKNYNKFTGTYFSDEEFDKDYQERLKKLQKQFNKLKSVLKKLIG